MVATIEAVLSGADVSEDAKADIRRWLEQQHHATRLSERLRQAMVAIAQATGVDQALVPLVAAAAELAGLDGGAVYLVEGPLLRLRHQVGLPPGLFEGAAEAPLDDPVLQAVLAMDEPSDPTPIGGSYAQLGRSLGVRCVRTMAIRSGEEVLGFLTVASTVRDEPSERGLEAVRTLLVDAAAVLQRLSAEAAARRDRTVLRGVFDSLEDLVFVKDASGRFVDANRAFEEAVGVPLAVLVGATDQELFPADLADGYRRNDELVLATGAPHRVEERVPTPDGLIFADTLKMPLRGEDGRVVGLAGVVRDITERKRQQEERRELDQQIQQTQKMESLGVLAGGIAHDFNNILMAVLGHAELALDEVPRESAARADIVQIGTAASRAAELCQQMLAYSGKASFALEPLDLHLLIEEMAHLLKTSITKKVILNLRLDPNLPPILADPSQIRQIVLNLIINASDAMAERSGVITVSVGATACDGEYLRATELCEGLIAGRYLHLEVTDTGCGMDAATRARIFEPFFTTKFAGRGLGLAAVMGIVRAHRGALKVYSEPGQGTTFKILLPALDEPLRASDDEDAALAAWRGSGTILLAEDEETVRDIGARLFERLGFTVLAVNDGQQAVDLYRERAAEIDLVVLDLTMPHMDGAEAFTQLRHFNPAVKVLLASGYSEEDVASRFAGRSLVGVLQKPYTLRRLRGVLRGLC